MGGPRGRDDFPTLRVTNLSEDASDSDLWELFGRFAHRGRINRCVLSFEPLRTLVLLSVVLGPRAHVWIYSRHRWRLTRLFSRAASTSARTRRRVSARVSVSSRSRTAPTPRRRSRRCTACRTTTSSSRSSGACPGPTGPSGRERGRVEMDGSRAGVGPRGCTCCSDDTTASRVHRLASPCALRVLQLKLHRLRSWTRSRPQLSPSRRSSGRQEAQAGRIGCQEQHGPLVRPSRAPARSRSSRSLLRRFSRSPASSAHPARSARLALDPSAAALHPAVALCRAGPRGPPSPPRSRRPPPSRAPGAARQPAQL